MEAQRQDKKDLEVAQELGLLTKVIENINTKAEILESRLQKVMSNPPTVISGEAEEAKPELCDVARQIWDARYGVQKARNVLNYILDDLQL